jgi:hypothetical protein
MCAIVYADHLRQVCALNAQADRCLRRVSAATVIVVVVLMLKVLF